LFWGTSTTILGEAYAGLSTYLDGEFRIRTIAPVPAPPSTLALDGTEGIGYCGSVREPYLSRIAPGTAFNCFSENVTNTRAQVRALQGFGHVFTLGDDIESFPSWWHKIRCHLGSRA
jgi:hypothetical protein